jgi:hypothetical protein
MSDSANFDDLCNSFLRYNDLQQAEIKEVLVISRFISLPLMGKGHSRENVGTAVKFVDSRQKE